MRARPRHTPSTTDLSCRGASPLARQVRPISSRSPRLSSARPTGALRLRGPTIHMWRPGTHSTATQKITLCRSMRNLQAGHFRRALEGVASIYTSVARKDHRVGSSAGCRFGSPATASSWRTRAITRLVSSVIRTAAARCSAASVGSMPRSCASASRAASGLFSWC